MVSKEDEQNIWTPITTNGDLIEGYLNFKCNSTGKPVETLDFYLSATQPDLQNPNPSEWNLLISINNPEFDPDYSYVEKTLNLPDNDTWYFIAKATDDIGNFVYDSYEKYFKIEHFNELINYTYIDQEGRINHNSEIGVNPLKGHEWHISSLDVYINYSGDIDFLTTTDYNELYSIR